MLNIINESNCENNSNHCNYFVSRKKRYCRIKPRDGEEYCPEHQKPVEISESNLEESDTNNRIICPLDNKHTCYAKKLKKHLKICNARIKDTPEFVIRNINSGEEGSQTHENRSLSAFPVKDILATINKINKVYNEHLIDKVTTRFLQHPVVEEEMAKPEYGDKSKKHLKQASAILGLLEQHQMFKSETCFIEFGAGRGQLSCWISKVTEHLKNISVLLIEKASPKHKQDNKLNKTIEKIRRIRVDIADLVLDHVDEIKKARNIVGVTKHLCGAATDLALRCLMNTKENQDKIIGFIMTFCCHHRCRWAPFVGKDFFKAVELNETDFEIMCGLVSWATCGTGFSRDRRKIMEENNSLNEALNERDNEMGLSRREKEEVGKRCKHIMNWSRLQYLEKLGYKCLLHYYVDSDVSPENVCIVANKVGL